MTGKHLVTVRTGADPGLVCDLLDQHGAVVVEEFLTPGTLQALWADLGTLFGPPQGWQWRSGEQGADSSGSGLLVLGVDVPH
jgi:hypothetical protein